MLIEHVIAKRAANLMYLHIDDVDEAGHSYGWGTPMWYETVQSVDLMVGDLMKSLDTAGILNETLVILTADHGGEAQSHGNTDELCMNVPIYVQGPGVKHGYEIPVPRTATKGLNVRNMDVAATLVNALGFSLPKYWIGRVLEEIYH